MKENYFIFNEDLCVGCEACVVACTIENDVVLPLGWRKIYTTNNKKLPGVPLFNLSLACNHCEDPPCLNYCPANAYETDTTTGAVLVNSSKCIGCEYCTWNCPYDAPKYNSVTGIIEKCTFCNSRILNNLVPACANLCPTGALGFTTDSSTVASTNQSSIPKAPGPAIIINESTRENTAFIDETLFSDSALSKITTGVGSSFASLKEWPLILFTFITILLVGIAAAFEKSDYTDIGKVYVIIAIFTAAISSTMHLGKRFRLLRSIINIRRSWLSREIVFFGLFAGLFIIDMYMVNIPQSILVLTGLATVLSMDKIYKPLQLHWPHQFHSGQALVISISVFLIFSGFYFAFWLLLLIRFAYTLDYFRDNLVLLIIRYILPLMALILLQSTFSPQLAAGLLFIGELMDRLLFYSHLRKYSLKKYDTN